jgi:hypothetical protein
MKRYDKSSVRRFSQSPGRRTQGRLKSSAAALN